MRERIIGLGGFSAMSISKAGCGRIVRMADDELPLFGAGRAIIRGPGAAPRAAIGAR